MSKVLGAFVVALLLVATPAQAALFTLQSYSVDVRTEDPGLVVYATKLIDSASFYLDFVGDSETIELFRIGTTEDALNLDDWKKYDVDVAFKFSEPEPGFDGEAGGHTGAAWLLKSFGYIDWNNPFEVEFGNYGLLGITLENAVFGLPGSTKIDATFTLLSKDGGVPPTTVPEPTSALLLGIGALAMGVIRQRRQPVAR